MKNLTRPLFALLTLALVAGGFAQESFRLLEPKEIQELNEGARAAYQRAMKALDFVDRITAIQELDRASSFQPGHVPLAFLTANLAKDQARREFGEEARRYYAIALNAADRILRRSDIDKDPLTRDRAQAIQDLLQQELSAVEERDRRRMEVGLQVNLKIAEDFNLPPTVVLGKPRPERVEDPTAPFNLKFIEREEGAAPGTALAGAPGGGGLSPFGGGGAPFGQGAGAQPQPPAGQPPAGAPFGAAPGGTPFGGQPTGGGPFGGGAPPAGGGASPFAGGAPPFGGGAPASPFGGGASPFGGGAAPAQPVSPQVETNQK